VDNINRSIETAKNECQELSKQLGNSNGGLMQQAKELEKLGIKPGSTKKGENKIENTTVFRDYYENDDGSAE
jgi:hypothetical protein